MLIDGRAFWQRVDSYLTSRGETLGSLCAKIGVSYYTVNTQRKNHALPKVEQLFTMAETLGMTAEELVFGTRPVSISPEAEAVNSDPELRALVRAVMRDRRLLSALAAVVESSERTIGEGMA